MLKHKLKNNTNEYIFSGDYKNLEKIRKIIINNAMKAGFNEEVSEKIALAVDEACTNLIRYSFNYDSKQNIKISFENDDKFFIVNIIDFGKPFNLLNVQKPNIKEYLLSYKKGGLGIFLIRSLIDEIEYIPSNDDNPQNTLILKKLLA